MAFYNLKPYEPLSLLKLTRTRIENSIRSESMKNTLIVLLICFVFCKANQLNALVEGKIGKLDVSASLRASYDSKVFAMPSSSFNKLNDSQVLIK